MLTANELRGRVGRLIAAKGSVCWISVDSTCHLKVRIDPKSESSAFYFRVKKPSQISRRLGSLSDTSLTEARQQALSMLVKLENGEALPEAKSRTSKKGEDLSLSEMLQQWYEHEQSKPTPRWKTEDRKVRVKFFGIIKNHLKPEFGNRAFVKISAESLAYFLTNLYATHTSFATSLRCWLREALMFSERKGWCQDGYAKAQKLDLLIRASHWRHQGPRLHYAALPVSDMPKFMAELREVPGTTARCLEVDILTASRVNSVINMRWEDVDLKSGIWRCPKEFMKVSNNGDHIVYLSVQAQQIIASMPRVLPGGIKATWVFSTERGEKICNALTKAIVSVNERRQKRGLPIWIDPEQTRIAGKDMVPTPHGFRATFKSWTRSERLNNWNRFDTAAVERCLHHVIRDNYGGAYDRESFPEQQKMIWQAWADYCYSYRPE